MSSKTRKLLLALFVVGLAIPCLALSGLGRSRDLSEIGASACYDCHDDMKEIMEPTIHWRLGTHEADQERMCEACHGPGSEHAESEGDTPIPHTFKGENLERDVNATCVRCHVGGAAMEWQASAHADAGVLCTECHNVKEPLKPADLGSKSAMCSECHADQAALFDLPSHHPLREGKIQCVDCHDPHGAEYAMLKTDNINDLCYTCHADKEGPVLHEHEPVVENCLTCHNPKGAVNNNLLTLDEATLCLRCHAGHEDVHPRLNSPTLRAGYMTKCTRCHSQIHGSDLSGFVGPSRFIR
jgi:DmsE family decaheme c-type cytochrome